MGFALIALAVVAVVLVLINTVFGPTVKGFFTGLKTWSEKSMGSINANNDMNGTTAQSPK